MNTVPIGRFGDAPYEALLSRVEHVEAVLNDLTSTICAIRALVDRPPAVAAPNEAPGPKRTVVCVGDLQLDVEARRVAVRNVGLKLTAVEFKLLVALVERRGSAVPRGTLLVEVWRRSELAKTRTVDTHVKRLRDQLGTASRYIQTVRGFGYRFGDDEWERRAPRSAKLREVRAELGLGEPALTSGEEA